LEKRFSQHKAPSGKFCKKLHRAFNKYGRENFKIEAICQTDNQADADSLEAFLIEKRDTINNGYNLIVGGISGHSPFSGHTHSNESRAKTSKALMGRTFSKETRAKLSKSQIGNKKGLGHKLTNENRVKLRRANLGRKVSQETRDKISKSLLDFFKKKEKLNG
jgi:group I intron endonuclease